MKIYSNVNRFLEEISTAVTADNKFIDKSEVYHALMKAILLDGVTVAPNVVLSLDEAEDILRDLVNKDQPTTCCQDNTCCQAPDKTCASHEEESAEQNEASDDVFGDVPDAPAAERDDQADPELPCGGETRCCEEEIDDSDEDDDDCKGEDSSDTPSLCDIMNHRLLSKLLDKKLFVNGIDYTSQPDGAEHLTIENIQIS